MITLPSLGNGKNKNKILHAKSQSMQYKGLQNVPNNLI